MPSLGLMPRAVVIMTAYSIAVVSGSSVAAWNASVPGRTMIKHAREARQHASQRRLSTRSFSTNTDNAVTNSGAAKAIAVASANGREFRPR